MHKKRKIKDCNRCAHPPQLLRFPPLAKEKPFGNPQGKLKTKYLIARRLVGPPQVAFTCCREREASALRERKKYFTSNVYTTKTILYRISRCYSHSARWNPREVIDGSIRLQLQWNELMIAAHIVYFVLSVAGSGRGN